MLGLAALILGLIKKYGVPVSLDGFFVEALYDENMLMIPYMGVTLMIGCVNLVLYAPLLIHGLLESGDIIV